MIKNLIALLTTSLVVVACSSLSGSSQESRHGATTCDLTASGLACKADSECAANEECDDGRCKLHEDACDDGGGAACKADTDCAEGQECDDGACKAHSGGAGSGSGSGATCTTASDCAAGQECDDGACKAHGGGHH
jgi:hypothetical protein